MKLIVFGLKALRADEVTAWNLAATNTALTAGQSPAVRTRTYTTLHIAIHDALNSIDRRFPRTLWRREQHSVSLRSRELRRHHHRNRVDCHPRKAWDRRAGCKTHGREFLKNFELPSRPIALGMLQAEVQPA